MAGNPISAMSGMGYVSGYADERAQMVQAIKAQIMEEVKRQLWGAPGTLGVFRIRRADGGFLIECQATESGDKVLRVAAGAEGIGDAITTFLIEQRLEK